MKKRVADIVVETLVHLGVTECFSVVGGGAMHLNNAFEINQEMNVTFCHHEQACGFAAEGYAKYSGKPAAVCVTSGPGAVNTLNAVYSAWVDNAPMIVITGYPRTDTTVEACGLNLRYRGVQEYNIIPTVQGMTKYARLLTKPEEVQGEVVKAYQVAMTGRRGPVWLSIPLDIQVKQTETKEISLESLKENDAEQEEKISVLYEKLYSAKRPCILTGSAIRNTGAQDSFLQFLSKVKIPIVGGALLADTLPENYSLYYGMSGNVGPRAGNFILQNADLILVIGNSLATKQTGFEVEQFAPNAYFAMVDIEKDEAKKPGLHIELPIIMDVKKFFDYYSANISGKVVANAEWIDYCDQVYKYFVGYDEPDFEPKDRVPAKLFWKYFREKLPESASVALGNSASVFGIYQYGTKSLHQRVITNYNAGSMGYDLPEAVGMAIASKEQIFCVTGDGSIMMNLQELQTIQYNKLPVKVVVFSNDGYGAIRQTCQNFFKGVYTGCDEKSGISFPKFEDVAKTFDFQYLHCTCCEQLEDKIDFFVEMEGNVLLEIEQKLDDPILPKLMSKLKPDGTFETPTLLDLYPHLDETIINKWKAY